MYELSLHNGITYIGEYLGFYEQKHGLKNPYRIIPVPKTNRDGSFYYEPSLLPISFFNKNEKIIIYLQEQDVLYLGEITDVEYIEKYSKLLKL